MENKKTERAENANPINWFHLALCRLYHSTAPNHSFRLPNHYFIYEYLMRVKTILFVNINLTFDFIILEIRFNSHQICSFWSVICDIVYPLLCNHCLLFCFSISYLKSFETEKVLQLFFFIHADVNSNESTERMQWMCVCDLNQQEEEKEREQKGGTCWPVENETKENERVKGY